MIFQRPFFPVGVVGTMITPVYKLLLYLSKMGGLF